MTYRLVVFDFDGTLADSEASIMRSLELVAEDLGLSGIDRSNARKSIGLPLQRTIEMGLGLDPGRASGAVELYRKHYHEVAYGSTRLFPGVVETLDVLLKNNFLLAVASGKSTAGLNAMMEHLGIAERFCFVAGAQDVQRPKPAPDMVLKALTSLDVAPEECLVVGDTVHDIEMGQRAGAHTCAVTYGNNSAEELRRFNPTFMVDSLSDIQLFLQTIS
ncbi:HAD family hydrolase [Prosthecochloris sp. N3]|uniref:HAD family hydrolase n=1 Tax=Prosthecochloris ethylica TaxID=2743976 RepID=A0ABR9XU23_9CHLB|nr:HAD family hydrolase [Prosthecochloris ethylica]MBF0587110.1 HAD family hydrolase [Prosthecochloris ethylica]MBF0637412.1 HAD family hydrolase [Prosthecochloris ethylica]NUK48052.1 HAD family hydrolase [Prosthecochloris ethylica]